MRTKRWARLAARKALLTWFLSPVALSLCQGTTGEIRGTVVDPTGSLVPEVNLEATHVSTNRKYATISTAAGVYSLTGLAVGEYKVTAQRSGFKESVRQVLVTVASTTTLNLTLELGEVNK